MTEEERMEWLQKRVINYLRQQPSAETPKPHAKVLKFRKKKDPKNWEWWNEKNNSPHSNVFNIKVVDPFILLLIWLKCTSIFYKAERQGLFWSLPCFYLIKNSPSATRWWGVEKGVVWNQVPLYYLSMSRYIKSLLILPTKKQRPAY